ncbi:BBSome-interacting protein 1 [Corapipo altera]|uniref:BBSome-interacting protein 1 n=1 Tax=Corapipo altera TaxID=415028 RepID=UPI000FD64786|nr:BBSome-interacting protein 1 [Corapipo altera]
MPEGTGALREVLPKQGQLSVEDAATMVLCKPKILPLKSVSLEKLEKLQRAALEAAPAIEDSADITLADSSGVCVLKGEQQKLLSQASRVSCATAASPASGAWVPVSKSLPCSLFLSDCVTRQVTPCTNQRKGIVRIFVSNDVPQGKKTVTQQLPLLSPVLQSSSTPDLPAIIQFPTLHRLQKQHLEQHYRSEQRNLNKDLVFQLTFNGKKLSMIKK